jgi:hypothetical protein
MKKKFFLPVLAIVAVAGVCMFSAFKEAQKARFATMWYEYDGVGSITDASSYQLLATQPADEEEAAALCEGAQEICAIQAPEGSNNHPDTFSSSMVSEINAANTSKEESTNVKLREQQN